MEFSDKWSFRVYCLADPNFSLAIRDGNLVLTPFNPSNDFHFWYKDMSTTKNVKDKDGSETCFVLVNKATGDAIQHSTVDQPVSLVPFKENIIDLSLLLSESLDAINNGYKRIRLATDTNLFFDAHTSETRVEDGTKIYIRKSNNKKTHRWRIERYLSMSPRPPTFRIYCKENPKVSLTIRDNNVVLSRHNENDDLQLWYKYDNEVKDADGNPGFSLINKATGQAIKHSAGSEHKVQLAFYYTNLRDDSVIWTMVRDPNNGYGNIRMVNSGGDLYLCIRGGAAGYGAEIVTYEKNGLDSQQWTITQCRSCYCC